MANIYPIASMADGGVRYSDGSIKYSSGSNATGTGTGGYPVYSTGSVLGTSNNGSNSTPAPQPTSNNNNFDAVRGNEENRQNESNKLIDEAYGAVTSALDSASSRIRGLVPTYEEEAKQQFQTNKGVLDASKQDAETQLGEQRISTEERNIDVANEAARLFNQLKTKGTQMFGGASGASEGYQAALAQEQQRASAVRAREYSTAMRELEDAGRKVETDYNNSLMQLTQTRDSAIRAVKTWMEEKLAEIDMQKGQASQSKAMAKLEVLQTMRNNLFNIESAIAEQKQQLDLQKQQYSNQLTSAADSLAQWVQQGQAGSEGLNSYNPSASGMVMGASTEADQGQTYIGNTGKKDEDYLLSSNSGGGGSW